MKRRVLSVAFIVGLILLSTSLAMAGKPPKTSLFVTITCPIDGLAIEQGETFEVVATVLANHGDAWQVDSYVQYALDEGLTSFIDVGEETQLHILDGFEQPQTQVLANGEFYQVTWVLGGNPGTYEVRVLSQAATAKSGSSQSHTVTIKGPPPPPGIETIDGEYQDSETGFGLTTGTFANTYLADGTYEILTEEINKQGTKKPIDDTTAMGWVYVFDNLNQRDDTALCLYGHADCNVDKFGINAFDDTDSAFFIQVKISNTWMTIGSITRHDVTNKMYCWDIADDNSETIEIRVIDNDRAIGNTEISSLFVDQAYIVFEPADEYIITDLPSNVGRRALKIADIDGDTTNEVILGLQDQTLNPLRYYDNANGLWSEHLIPVSLSSTGSDPQGIIALDVGDLDGDGQNEVVVGLVFQSGQNELRYYDYQDSIWIEKQIANLNVPILSVTIGDLDNDNTLEPVVGLISSSIGSGYELRYYEHLADEWEEVDVADFGSSSDGTGGVECVKIGDIDHDSLNELVCMVVISNYQENSALKYYELDSGNWVRHDILNVPFGWEIDIGDVDNDNQMEIAWGNYAQDSNEVRVYDYDEIADVWLEEIVSDVPGGCADMATPVHHIAIGDVDNDDLNELAIGIFDDGWRGLSNEAVRYYKYIAGVWSEFNVTDPDLTAEVVQIGDVDNDGQNELLFCLVSWYSYSTQIPELRYCKAG